MTYHDWVLLLGVFVGAGLGLMLLIVAVIALKGVEDDET